MAAKKTVKKAAVKKVAAVEEKIEAPVEDKIEPGEPIEVPAEPEPQKPEAPKAQEAEEQQVTEEVIVSNPSSKIINDPIVGKQRSFNPISTNSNIGLNPEDGRNQCVIVNARRGVVIPNPINQPHD